MASAHGTAMAARLQAIQPTPAARARDWAEIQERTLVPLYDAVHQRLTVGQGVSLLDLGCRSGLALLLAAGRGARVAGLEPDPELRELARARRLWVTAGAPATRTAHDAVTVFEPLRLAEQPLRAAQEAARLVPLGGLVALAALGPEQDCQSAAVLEVARRRGGPRRSPTRSGSAGRVSCRLCWPAPVCGWSRAPR